MAYIYLEELEKILPGILDQWIDKDDESWEWIFQEIEQKCYVGKKEKKKKKVSKIDAIEIAIMAHRNDINELTNKVSKLNDICNAHTVRLDNIGRDITAAKSMAETAKRRTEVDYSKYSGKSDGTVSYDSASEDINQWRNEHESDRSRFNNKCGSCKHLSKQPIDQPCIDCRYNMYNKSGMDKWEANLEERRRLSGLDKDEEANNGGNT